MANLEQTLREFDVIAEPENTGNAALSNQPCLADEKEKVPDEIPPADSTAIGDQPAEEKDGKLHGQQFDVTVSPEVVCPRVNCTEKILFCLDLSSEMTETFFRSRAGDKMSAFRETVKALRMYIMNKHRINPNHEYGLAAFSDHTCWVRDFTKPKEILNIFEDLLNQESVPTGDFDLSDLFDVLGEHISLPEVFGDVRVVPPPYIVRVFFVYGRSRKVPLFTDKQLHLQLESSPYFFLDVLYVHEPPSEENKCEEIFTGLCELDHKGLSYILEAASLTRLFDCTSMLLAHPLQRPVQRQADYHLPNASPGEEQVIG
ncbi:BRISC and BRCA1-A complex member 1-like [Littorina saxatilis]|uniref:BRISC and BRCA1-A complex member 1 n=1 Tax=Littorina saxatilis TaxID=31220 RepID=A0AAN9B733_9CAEN